MQGQTKTKRIEYLDAIRGIACMMVVVMHFIDFRWDDNFLGNLAVIVFNGNDAVSFFFVLSGFVLSYPYLQKGRQLLFWPYLKKRIFRLYPAYWVTVIVCFFYLHRETLDAAHLHYIFIQNGGPKFWNEMTMVMNEHHLYFPGWSLRVEMVFSILMVPLIMLTKHKKSLLIFVLLGAFFVGEPKLRSNMIHFILGITLALQYPKLIKTDFKQTVYYPYRWLLYLGLFCLYSLQHLKEFFPIIETIFDFLWQYKIYWQHFSAIAAYGMLALVIMNKRAQNFLENKALLFLGKISYSIYLVHLVVITFIMDHWDLWGNFLDVGLIRLVVMFILYLVVVVVLAQLMYRYIELPFMKMGRNGFSALRKKE